MRVVVKSLACHQRWVASIILFASLPTLQATAVDPYVDIVSWRQGYFSDPGGLGQGADSADPDSDGQKNILEYALGSNPTSGKSRGNASLGIDGNDLLYRYERVRTDVIYTVETSTNFVTWSAEGVNQGSLNIGLVTARIPNGIVDGKFTRLKITANGVDYFVPLFSSDTELEPVTTVDAPEARYTYFSDRGRDRHAREDQFEAYDHYLSFYWEHRTAEIEIVDTIGKGGSTITFNVKMQWNLKTDQAELRGFYRGIGTVAEYHDNKSMTPVNYQPANGPFFSKYPDALSPLHDDVRYYTRIFNYNQKEKRPIQLGDRLEFELSQFLESPPNGRENYYGTTYLYIVGQGLVPWEAHGVFGDASTEREDSYPIPEEGWLGGRTTLPYMYSAEPDNHFMQMATNLAPVNGQKFVLGRRVHHTDFGDGTHDETVSNPAFDELSGMLGKRYVNRSCVACHAKNGRALPPAVNSSLDQYVFKLGDGNGNPHASAGAVLQPKALGGGTLEGTVKLAEWAIEGDLRKPVYAFEGISPAEFSARIAPQLVGMGLLEAIPESTIAAKADPDDANGDGISGRMHIVEDPETNEPRVGRFGWKAGQASVRSQVASALNTDIGVMTSVYPKPDTGLTLPVDEDTGAELSDEHLDNLSTYISLLGVRAQRDLNNPAVIQGRQLFETAKCSSCHTPTVVTSPYAKHAELRSQTIHPYTDLLLHDMGPGLADNLGERDASGSEWRTPPLWGIGLTAGVSEGVAYLHDGRARTLDEAIRWHGGEADGSRQAYESLSQSEKDALITFLRSL